MSIYPGSIPPNGTATPNVTLAVAQHTALHNVAYDEVGAIAMKLGISASVPTTGTVLRGTGAGSSAWGQSDLATDITGVLPIANGGTGGASTGAARTSLGVNTALETLALVYPIGSIYMNAGVSTNPVTLLGFGTWTVFGAGRVLIGVGTSDQAFAASATGGESSHTLTTTEMPAHTHDQKIYGNNMELNNGGSNYRLTYATDGGNNVSVTGVTGGGIAHNNLQPYIVVYMWQRTA